MSGMLKKYLALGIGIALFVGIGGYLFLVRQGALPAFRDIDLGNGIIIKDVPVGTDISISTSSAPTPPSLTRPISISTSMSADVAALYKKKIQDARAALQAEGNASSFDTWGTLGTLYQEVGDYEGARQVFVYLSAISPKNIVSFNNLGILYHFYLKDYPKAEENFRRAIQNDPTYILSYRNLFDLYTLSYKVHTSAAADIIEEGLKKNPNNPDLLQLKAQLNAQ